jgi:hypothetical protein
VVKIPPADKVKQQRIKAFGEGEFGSMKLILYGFMVFFGTWLASCQPKPAAVDRNGSAPAPAPKEAVGQGDEQALPAGAEKASVVGKAPSINSQDLQAKSGTSAGSAIAAPQEFANKPYIGMLTTTHRPIWLDLTKQVWTGFNAISDKFVAGYEAAITEKRFSEYIRRILARPEVPLPLKVSIQQPIAAPWLPRFAPEVTVLFSVVGFAAWKGEEDGGKTLMLAESPFVPASKEVLLQEPSNYQEVYTKQGPLLVDFIKQCQEQLNSTSSVMDHARIAECEGLYGSVDLLTYNETTKLANNAFTDLFQKRSVKIWRPQCPEGYAALGDIATNGRMDKPYSEADYSQGPFSSAYTPSSKKATYCLPQKYLAPGKKGKAVYKEGTSAGLELYAIEPANEHGIAAQGLFVTKAGNSPLPAKLWVIDKRYIEIVASP